MGTCSRNIQTPFQTWISERLCGAFPFHRKALRVWLVVTEGVLGEKIWNPVSLRTETV